MPSPVGGQYGFRNHELFNNRADRGATKSALEDFTTKGSKPLNDDELLIYCRWYGIPVMAMKELAVVAHHGCGKTLDHITQLFLAFETT